MNGRIECGTNDEGENLGYSLTPTFEMLTIYYISLMMAASDVLRSFCGGLREGEIEDIYI
jgi:hypothetical protein